MHFVSFRQYQIAMIDRACKRTEEGTAILHTLASKTEGEDLVWANKAARILPGYDKDAWSARLSATVARVDLDSLSNSYRVYTIGMLQQAAGQDNAAKATFRKALLLPDQTLSYHLTRLAIEEPGQ